MRDDGEDGEDGEDGFEVEAFGSGGRTLDLGKPERGPDPDPNPVTYAPLDVRGPTSLGDWDGQSDTLTFDHNDGRMPYHEGAADADADADDFEVEAEYGVNLKELDRGRVQGPMGPYNDWANDTYVDDNLFEAGPGNVHLGRRTAATPKIIDRLVTKFPQFETGIRQLAADDPTGSLRWLDWGVKQLRTGYDADRISRLLSIYWARREELKEPTYFTTIEEAEMYAADVEAATAKRNKVVYAKDGWQITQVFDRAGLFFAAGCRPTSWCVGWEATKHWAEYAIGDWRMYVVHGPSQSAPYLVYFGPHGNEIKDKNNLSVRDDDVVHDVLDANKLSARSPHASALAALERRIKAQFSNIVGWGNQYLYYPRTREILELDSPMNIDALVGHVAAAIDDYAADAYSDDFDSYLEELDNIARTTDFVDYWFRGRAYAPDALFRHDELVRCVKRSLHQMPFADAFWKSADNMLSAVDNAEFSSWVDARASLADLDTVITAYYDRSWPDGQERDNEDDATFLERMRTEGLWSPEPRTAAKYVRTRLLLKGRIVRRDVREKGGSVTLDSGAALEVTGRSAGLVYATVARGSQAGLSLVFDEDMFDFATEEPDVIDVGEHDVGEHDRKASARAHFAWHCPNPPNELQEAAEEAGARDIIEYIRDHAEMMEPEEFLAAIGGVDALIDEWWGGWPQSLPTDYAGVVEVLREDAERGPYGGLYRSQYPDGKVIYFHRASGIEHVYETEQRTAASHTAAGDSEDEDEVGGGDEIDDAYAYVGCAVVLNDAGEVLITHRTGTAPWKPLWWDVPGGHIDRGESPEAAARREAHEEAGLSLGALTPLGMFGGDFAFFLARVTGRPAVTVRPNPEGILEHDDHAWVTPETIDDYQVVEPARAAIRAAWQRRTAAPRWKSEPSAAEAVGEDSLAALVYETQKRGDLAAMFDRGQEDALPSPEGRVAGLPNVPESLMAQLALWAVSYWAAHVDGPNDVLALAAEDVTGPVQAEGQLDDPSLLAPVHVELSVGDGEPSGEVRPGYPLKMTLTTPDIDVSDVDTYRRRRRALLRAVRHELIHLLQMKGVGDYGGDRDWSYGYATPHGPHEERTTFIYPMAEEELYPYLSEEVDRYHEEGEHDVKSWVRRSSFFAMLARYRPELWKKAVSAFAKAVSTTTRTAAGPELISRLVKKFPEVAEGIQQLAASDPTGDLRWLDWSVKQLRAGHDIARISRLLTTFFAHRDALGEPTQYKTLEAAETEAATVATPDVTTTMNKVVYTKDGWQVTQVFDREGLFAAAGCNPTKWCVGWNEVHHWDEYTRDGDDWRMYVVHGPSAGSPYLAYFRDDDNFTELKDRGNASVDRDDDVYAVLADAGLAIAADPLEALWADLENDIRNEMESWKGWGNRWVLAGEWIVSVSTNSASEEASHLVAETASEVEGVSPDNFRRMFSPSNVIDVNYMGLGLGDRRIGPTKPAVEAFILHSVLPHYDYICRNYDLRGLKRDIGQLNDFVRVPDFAAWLETADFEDVIPLLKAAEGVEDEDGFLARTRGELWDTKPPPPPKKRKPAPRRGAQIPAVVREVMPDAIRLDWSDADSNLRSLDVNTGEGSWIAAEKHDLPGLVWFEGWAKIGKLPNRRPISPENAGYYATLDAADAPPVNLIWANGRLRVVDGEHRITAARMRGDKHVLAHLGVPADLVDPPRRTKREAGTAQDFAEVEKYVDTGAFFTFSDTPKFSARPLYGYGSTPHGFYGYPLTRALFDKWRESKSLDVDFASERAYVLVWRFKDDGGTVLDLDKTKFTAREVQEAVQIAFDEGLEALQDRVLALDVSEASREVLDAVADESMTLFEADEALRANGDNAAATALVNDIVPSRYAQFEYLSGWIDEQLREAKHRGGDTAVVFRAPWLASDRDVLRWNQRLREMGFSGVIDSGAGAIHPNESAQAVALDPTAVEPLAVVRNPTRGYDETRPERPSAGDVVRKKQWSILEAVKAGRPVDVLSVLEAYPYWHYSTAPLLEKLSDAELSGLVHPSQNVMRDVEREKDYRARETKLKSALEAVRRGELPDITGFEGHEILRLMREAEGDVKEALLAAFQTTKTAAHEPLEQLLDALSGQDLGRRQRLDRLVRSLIMQGYEPEEIDEELLRNLERAERFEQKLAPVANAVVLSGETPEHWVLRIKEWSAAHELGSNNWCIVRSEDYWNDYVARGITFYFYVSKADGLAEFAVAQTNHGSEVYDRQDAMVPILDDLTPTYQTLSDEGRAAHERVETLKRQLQTASIDAAVDILRTLSKTGEEAFVGLLRNPRFVGVWKRLEQEGLDGRYEGILDAVKHKFPQQVGSILNITPKEVTRWSDLGVSFDDIRSMTNAGIDAAVFASWRALDVDPSVIKSLNGLTLPQPIDIGSEWEAYASGSRVFLRRGPYFALLSCSAKPYVITSNVDVDDSGDVRSFYNDAFNALAAAGYLRKYPLHTEYDDDNPAASIFVQAVRLLSGAPSDAMAMAVLRTAYDTLANNYEYAWVRLLSLRPHLAARALSEIDDWKIQIRAIVYHRLRNVELALAVDPATSEWTLEYLASITRSPKVRAVIEARTSRTERRARVAMPLPTDEELPPGYSVDMISDGDMVTFSLSNEEDTTVAEVTIARRGDGDYQVKNSHNSEPRQPWGAYLYEKALEWVTSEGGYLMPDDELSPLAERVWRRYHQDRPDVESRPTGREVVTMGVDDPTPWERSDVPHVYRKYRHKKDPYSASVTAATKADYLYHVTFAHNLESIAETGLVPGMGGSFGGYGWTTPTVFLTSAEGVSYWFGKYRALVEDRYEGESQVSSAPVVLRVDRDALDEDLLSEDEVANRESIGAHAWRYEGSIDAADLEAWNGHDWGDLEVDVETLTTVEQHDEDDGTWTDVDFRSPGDEHLGLIEEETAPPPREWPKILLSREGDRYVLKVWRDPSRPAVEAFSTTDLRAAEEMAARLVASHVGVLVRTAAASEGAFVREARTLWHGTSKANAARIRTEGLVPRVGPWVRDSYGTSLDLDEGMDEGEKIFDPKHFEVTFAADKRTLDAALGGVVAAVAHQLGKHFDEVTDAEVVEHGALLKIESGDRYMRRRPKQDEPENEAWERAQAYGDGDDRAPPTVEPGDWYSRDIIDVDAVVTGPAMVRVFRQGGVWPRLWGPDEKRNRRERELKRRRGAKDLKTALMSLRPAMAAAAQAVLDAWQPDEEGLDDVYGGGGVCDDVCRALEDVLSGVDATIIEGGQPGDDHAYLVVYDDVSAYVVDIPADVYETGGGYAWQKREDVVLSADDVVVDALPRDWVENDREAHTRSAAPLRLNVWVSPEGEVFESGASHDKWALAQRGTTANGLLDEGWIRVAPPDAVQIRRLEGTRDRVERVVRELMAAYDVSGVWVETDDDNIFVARLPTGRPDFAWRRNAEPEDETSHEASGGVGGIGPLDLNENDFGNDGMGNRVDRSLRRPPAREEMLY